MRKCIVCGKETMFPYKIAEVEAPFCCGHLPGQSSRTKLMARVCFCRKLDIGQKII